MPYEGPLHTRAEGGGERQATCQQGKPHLPSRTVSLTAGGTGELVVIPLHTGS